MTVIKLKVPANRPTYPLH